MKRTILITGATSGIGEALAKLAAQSGYSVLACGRNQQKLQDLANCENISALAFDISNETACNNILQTVSADIYVFNAGTCEYVDLDDFQPSMFKRVFEANFFGVVNCLAAIVPKLENGNQVVFVDSLARCLPFTRSQAYGASKAAMRYLAKTMEVDLVDKGVVVQCASPGFVKTPLTDKNEFDMPMRISATEAAEALLKGIEKGKRNIYFPTLFAWIIRTLSQLPDKLQRNMCIRMKQQ